jgi:hypothetical protein
MLQNFAPWKSAIYFDPLFGNLLGGLLNRTQSLPGRSARSIARCEIALKFLFLINARTDH